MLCPIKALSIPARALEFHDLKGVVEQVIARFQMRTVYFDRFPSEAGLNLHGFIRIARHGLSPMASPLDGSANCIHRSSSPQTQGASPLGEIYVDRLYKLPLRKPAARDISRFQPVRRDFSLILDENIAWDNLDQALASLQIPEMVDWRAREVFRDPQTRRARVCTAPRRHLPGPRPHAA